VLLLKQHLFIYELSTLFFMTWFRRNR